MGNYNTRAVRFLQSPSDFPCPVALGKNTPSFGLYRFNKGLRFVPPDDEGFTLRGDKQRLLYKGRRRSHRFTILGDTAFEYDCILEKPPDTNTVSLVMEGAEHFVFFRQPDYLSDPLLAGSYAVYKKETLIGEGTGKLCHIHRPEIIDARGRRCWGDLAVVGNELQITIPECWLSEAKYPVIVDPTVGTSTVGSQYLWDNDPPEPWVPLMFEGSIPVNRFQIPEALNGLCTAYFYTNDDENPAGCRPVLYTDMGDKPQNRFSKDEEYINLRVTGGNPKGWRSGTFRTSGIMAGNAYVWFGAFVDFFWFPRFDFGAKCYCDEWWDRGDTIPNSYPIYNANWYQNFKLSMYFTYTVPQNYVRTLTQSVKLTDTRKLKADYIKKLAQTAGVNSLLGRFETFYRNCVMTAHNSMNVGRFPVFIRNVTETIKATLGIDNNRSISRKCDDTVNVNSQTSRFQDAICIAQDIVSGADGNSYTVLFVRSVTDIATVNQSNSHWGDFIHGLAVNAGSEAETTHKSEYYRFQVDTVQAAGAVFRGLLLFVRIVTKVFIRDYLLNRFLVAREELVLKSAICREITLDSRIG